MAAIRDAASSVRPHPPRAQASSSPSRRRARLALAAAATALPLLASPLAHADPLYWDINGTTANSGTTAAGTWTASSSNWNTDSTGGAAGTVGSWVGGSTAVFSSGSGHTGGFTVTVGDTETVGGIRFEEGSVTLIGTATGAGALDIGSGSVTIETTHTGQNFLRLPVTGSGDLNFVNSSGGDVTFNLNGPMSGFTGNITVGAGTDATKLTKLQMDWATGNASKTISLNSFSELSNDNQRTLGDGTLTPTTVDIANPIALLGSDAWLACAAGPGTTQKIVTYSGNITGSGNLWIGINNSGGNGTVVLGGNNSYAGNTYMVMSSGNGLVQLDSDNALPSTTNLVFGPQSGGSAAVAPLDLNGHNVSVASLASTSTGTVRGIMNTSATPVTLTLNQDTDTTFKGVIGSTNTSFNPFNNRSPYQGNVTAYSNISLVKNGTGALTLSAAGNTIPSVTINGGTVAFTSNATDGALIGPSTVTVGPAGTLATGPGNVTLNASITAAGAVAPGGVGTVGNMNISGGNLDFNDGSSLIIDFLNSASYDTLSSNANINLDSGIHTFDLNLATGGTLTPGTYHIAIANNVNWDGINGFTLGSAPSSAFNYSLVPNGSFLDLMITPNSPIYRWSLGGSYPVIEGGGDWSDGSGNFIDLSTNTPATWSNSNPVDVIIGGDNVNGIGNIIHLTSDVVINGKLTFAPVIQEYPYKIGDGSGHTLTLSPAANTPGLQVDTSAIINAPVTLATSQTWTVAGSSNVLLVNQPVSGAGNTLTKNGTGIAILAAPGGSLGTLNVTQGALLVRDPSAIGATTPVSLDTNGAFGLDASISVANPITVGTGGGTLVVSGANTGTMTGAINATGPVTKSGSGVLVLTNAANTIPSLILKGFSGTDPSYVAVDSPAPLGSGPITLSGGGIRALASMTIPNDFTLSGRGTGAPGASNPGAGDFDRIDTGSNDVTLTGVLSGNGDMIKYGSGSLTLSGANTVAGGAFYVRENSTIVAKSASAFGSNNIALHSDATISTPSVDVLASTIRGDSNVVATLHKTGAATLVLGAVGGVPGSGGPNVPGSTAVIDEGAIQLNSVGGLGGNAQQDYMNIVVNPGGELLGTFDAERLGGSITLAGGTITRPLGAPTSDTILLQAYGSNNTSGISAGNPNVVTDHGNALTVTASSLIRNLSQNTSTASNLIGFSGPVAVNSGATLTVDNENTGGYDANNVIVFRGSALTTTTDSNNVTSTTLTNPNDAFTLQHGATVTVTGPGQTRFGRSNVIPGGKTIVGQGAPGSESLIRFGPNVWFYDNAPTPTAPTTSFVVAGSGSAGLRIEAAMNASYRPSGDSDPTHHDGFTGLFGTNGSQATNNNFTVLSPVRLAALSTTVGPNTIGGTLTVAATDASDVVGEPLTAGPAAPVGLTLAFDNAASSANAKLTYQLSGDVVNFAHVQAQKTNAGTGSVNLRLAGNSRVADLVLLNNTTLDLVDHGLAVESQGSIATYLSNNQLFSSAVDADTDGITTIAQLRGSELGLSGSDTLTLYGVTIDASTLLLKPAYFGDINLDGRINADDYALMDRSVAKALAPNWIHGDFNDDNLVDAGDYFLLDRSYAMTHGNVLSPSLLAQREAQFGDTYVSSLLASVPEPGTLSLLSLGVLPLLGRLRRSSR